MSEGTGRDPIVGVTGPGDPASLGRRTINAAVDSVLADLTIDAYPLVKGWTLDLAETLRTNTCAAEALITVKPAWKSDMVRTAILLAHPMKG